MEISERQSARVKDCLRVQRGNVSVVPPVFLHIVPDAVATDAWVMECSAVRNLNLIHIR